MSKISIGIVLGQLMKEQNLSAINIADRTGKSRQNVYMDLKRTSMRDNFIEEWANALGVNKEVIYERWNEKSSESIEKSSDYLVDHLTTLEGEFKKFTEQYRLVTEQLQNQLETKDRQIEKLMDLLGKLEPASSMSKSLPLWNSELLASA